MHKSLLIINLFLINNGLQDFYISRERKNYGNKLSINVLLLVIVDVTDISNSKSIFRLMHTQIRGATDILTFPGPLVRVSKYRLGVGDGGE